MTIAIIGAAGFIGSKLRKSLEQDNIVASYFDIEVGTSDSRCQHMDVEDTQTLEKLNGTDILLNLAAVHADNIKPKSKYYDVNVTGAENVCDIARKFNIKKIIFTSSVAIYGFSPPNTGENGKPNFFNEYGRTKYLAEQVYVNWQKEDPKARTLCIIRPTVVFGEDNEGNVNRLIQQILNKKFIMFGSGHNVKSMAYVGNIVEFLKFSLKIEGGSHVYNYVDKPDLTMNELISLIRTIGLGEKKAILRLPLWFGLLATRLIDVISGLSHVQFNISYIRMRKFSQTTQFNSSIKSIGFVQPHSLEAGLKRTIHHILSTNRNNDA